MKYFVDKDRRIVKATIDNCEGDVFKLVNKRITLKNLFNPVVLYEVLKLKKKYIGVAKCSPSDEFNEEIGRIIAARRASEKYEKDRKKVIERFCEYVNWPITEIEFDQSDRTMLAEVRANDTKNIVDLYEKMAESFIENL